MNAGPGGFGSAPVSKFLVLTTAGSSILLQNTVSRHTSSTSVAASLAQLLSFRHLGEVAFGTALLYYFRIFERQRGSERYGAFTVVNLAATQLTHWILVATTTWKLQSGPYGFLAANFVSFLNDIPPTQRFSIFGIQLNDKALVYAAGGQLLISAARHSWHSLLTGLLVGLAYQVNAGGFKGLKVPSQISRFLGRTIGRLLGGDGQRRRVIVTGNQENGASQGAGPTTHRRPPQRQAAARASPEALQQLIAMGFDEERAAAALQQSNNDVQSALSRLL